MRIAATPMARNEQRPVLSCSGSGTYIVGEVVTCSRGLWTGHRLTFTYQWQRDLVNIDGETAATHTLVAADIGTRVNCVVTATSGDSTYGARSMSSARSPIVSTRWSPTDLGDDLLAFWNLKDTASLTLASSKITAIADLSGNGRTLTAASTGPTYSAAARNGQPGAVFANSTAERLTFSPAGLPSGTSGATLVLVAYGNSAITSKVLFGYGGTQSGQGRVLYANTTGTVGYSLTTLLGEFAGYSWRGVDRILLVTFQGTGVVSPEIDGDMLAARPYLGAVGSSLAQGRIGCSLTDTSPWEGVFQCAMILAGEPSQLDKDKIEGWCAHEFGLTALLDDEHPYKSIPPTVESTRTKDVLSGYESVWLYDFRNGLSLRTGEVFGRITGYNHPNAKGIWAPSGHYYMTDPKGFGDFGHGFFLNPNYDWQSIDPTFPPLGMIDIVAEGVQLKGSDQYPLVRAQCGTSSGFPQYLSSLICTAQSAKIGIPFARRIRWYDNSSHASDFPAAWGLNERYNGVLYFTRHLEVDDFERFGVEYTARNSSQHTHMPSGARGGQFDTGATKRDAGTVLHETLVVYRSDFIFMFTDGMLCQKIPVSGNDADPLDKHHAILNMAVGVSWQRYPGLFTGSISGNTLTVGSKDSSTVIAIGQTLTAGANTRTITAGSGNTWTLDGDPLTVASSSMTVSPCIGSPLFTVESVEVFAPPSNTTGVFTQQPQAPGVAYAADVFYDDLINIPADTPVGTTLATYSGVGGAIYAIIPYDNAFDGVVFDGAVLKTSRSFVGDEGETYPFYVEVTAVHPMILPKIGLRVLSGNSAALSAPTLTSTEPTSATFEITTDVDSGTLYLTLSNAAGAPSKAQVRDGLNADGSDAPVQTSATVSASGVQTITVTGLTTGVRYYPHFVHQNAEGGLSAIASASSFKPSVVVYLDVVGQTTHQIPADFETLESVEVIGGGGSSNNLSAGGGGGAYAKITSTTDVLTPGATINIGVGAGGTATDGGDTWWNATSLADAVSRGPAVCVAAERGKTNAGTTGGQGGQAANSVGTLKYSGGNAGNSVDKAGAGGGAAGPLGNGGAGGSGIVTTTRGSPGGGGNGGGEAGNSTSTQAGGRGGHNAQGTGGGSGATAGNNNASSGSNGGGGGGASNATGQGGAGGNGIEWGDRGSGGGAGSSTFSSTGGAGGLYGGGGGGRSGSAGGQGIIRFKYRPL